MVIININTTLDVVKKQKDLAAALTYDMQAINSYKKYLISHRNVIGIGINDRHLIDVRCE